jgi:hypothetical protein
MADQVRAEREGRIIGINRKILLKCIVQIWEKFALFADASRFSIGYHFLILPSLHMKQFLTFLLVGLVTFAAQAAETPAASAPKSAKEARKAHRAARDSGPEVYKGQVALRVRMVTDAAGAENDVEPQDEQPAKTSRKQARLDKARPAADLHAAAGQ